MSVELCFSAVNTGYDAKQTKTPEGHRASEAVAFLDHLALQFNVAQLIQGVALSSLIPIIDTF